MHDPQPAYRELVEEDFLCAMKEMEGFVDITSHDLLELYHLACKYSEIRMAESVYVRDVMTRDVATVTPQSSLAEAARVLLLRNLRSLPVVDEQGRVVGIITEADLLEEIGIPCHHPVCTLWNKLHRLFSHARHIHGLTGKVEDSMQRAPVTTLEDETLHEAIEKMKRRHVKSLVVTDVGGYVRGILTRSNVVKAFLSAMKSNENTMPEGSDFC